MIGVVVSEADTASVTIGNQLLERRDWAETDDETRPAEEGGGTVYRSDPFELRTFDEWHLELDYVDEVFGTADQSADLIVFASRHSGETGPLLTAHHTGNFGEAEYGGTDRSLATAAPAATRMVLQTFQDVAPEEYDVGLECTHHGPTEVTVPSLFVELGSGESQWTDQQGATAAAAAIESLAEYQPATERTFIGIGGGHYAPKFTRIVTDTDWAVGHIAADWSLDQLTGSDDELLLEMRRQPEVSYVVTDGSYPALEDVFVDAGCRIVGETWLRETTGVALDVVERLESELRPIEDGLRFGVPAESSEANTYIIQSMPAELIDDLQRIDQTATINILQQHCVAYTTTDRGNRADNQMALPAGPERHNETAVPAEMVDAMCELLATDYETVQVDSETIRVETKAFDPARAAELGVPEGPKFGQLADGNAVTVNGETIQPEAVQTQTTHTYTLPS